MSARNNLLAQQAGFRAHNLSKNGLQCVAPHVAVAVAGAALQVVLANFGGPHSVQHFGKIFLRHGGVGQRKLLHSLFGLSGGFIYGCLVNLFHMVFSLLS